jgi:lipoate-protein ligase A
MSHERPNRSETHAAGWRVEHLRGTAQDLHDLDVTGERLVRVHEVLGPSVVMGSSPPDRPVDSEALAALGASTAQRRSGGGAVWLAPGCQVWMDLVVPVGDPLWSDDVVRASGWVGELWCAALAGLEPGRPPQVHRGEALRRDEGRLACFAGLSPGEVCGDDGTGTSYKLVGVSQRRTRSWARFQTVAYLRWDPEPLVRCLGLGAPDDLAGRAAAALRERVVAVGPAESEVTAALVVERLLAALPCGTSAG